MKIHAPVELGFDAYSGCILSKQFLQWEHNETYEDFMLQAKHYRPDAQREWMLRGLQLLIKEKVADVTIFMPKKPLKSQDQELKDKWDQDERDEGHSRKKRGKR